MNALNGLYLSGFRTFCYRIEGYKRCENGIMSPVRIRIKTIPANPHPDHLSSWRHTQWLVKLFLLHPFFCSLTFTWQSWYSLHLTRNVCTYGNSFYLLMVPTQREGFYDVGLSVFIYYRGFLNFCSYYMAVLKFIYLSQQYPWALTFNWFYQSFDKVAI